jgi:hypothetical protein
MPRTARIAPGGTVFHVLNRGVARMQLFDKPADYHAFERVLQETRDETPMRICAYCVMPNHWHLLPVPLDPNNVGLGLAVGVKKGDWVLHSHPHFLARSGGKSPFVQRIDDVRVFRTDRIHCPKFPPDQLDAPLVRAVENAAGDDLVVLRDGKFGERAHD